jgi:predicted ATPase
LKLLRGGARDAPLRQQTLRGTIDWSYEMLDSAERRLFELFSVFSGATFEAVEDVASRVKSLNELDVVEGLCSLVDKSLIRRTDRSDAGSRLVSSKVAERRVRETHRGFFNCRPERSQSPAGHLTRSD